MVCNGESVAARVARYDRALTEGPVRRRGPGDNGVPVVPVSRCRLAGRACFVPRAPACQHAHMGSARFTLVELMVVVAIVAVLAAIALPMVHEYSLRAKAAEVPLVIGGIELAARSACLEPERHVSCGAPGFDSIANPKGQDGSIVDSRSRTGCPIPCTRTSASSPTARCGVPTC